MDADEKKWIKKILIIVSSAIILFWLLWNISEVLGFISTVFSYAAPFIIGLAIAFIINVPMRFFERILFPKKRKFDKFRRPVALLITIIIFVLIVMAVYQIIVPELIETIKSVVTAVPGFFNEVKDLAEKFFSDYREIQEYITNFSFNWESIIKSSVSWLQTGVMSTFNVANTALSGIVSVFIGLIFAMYVIFQKESLSRQAKLIVYAKLKESTGDKIFKLFSTANTTFSNFLSGQCLEACILGMIFAIFMTIFRFPYMPLISVLIACTALIPVVGAFIGCAVGALLILIQNPIQAVWFVVMFIVLQQLENNIVYPKVVGTSVGLPSIWVLVAVTIGGNIMGVGGMLIMIPLCSILYALFREYIYDTLRKKKLNPQKIANKKF